MICLSLLELATFFVRGKELVPPSAWSFCFCLLVCLHLLSCRLASEVTCMSGFHAHKQYCLQSMDITGLRQLPATKEEASGDWKTRSSPPYDLHSSSSLRDWRTRSGPPCD